MNILSTCWPGSTVCTTADLNYVSASGTSMAAPHVAGAAALALSYPGCSAHTLGLKATIVTNVDSVSALTGPPALVSSGGRLNANKTLRGCRLQNLAVSPATGSGSSETFTFTFNDSSGYADIDVVDILIRDFLMGDHACYVAYSRTSNLLYLLNDAGTSIGNGYAPGSSSPPLSNSQCSINVASTTATGSGNVLTLQLVVTFTSGFAGDKVVYVASRDSAGGNSGWQAIGVWSVPGLSPPPASVTSWSPATSTSLNQTFTAVLNDTGGHSAISVVDILINTALTGGNACYIAYVPSSNLLYLVGDDGSTLLSPALTPTGTGTVSNTQCQISAAGSSVQTDRNNPNALSVNVAVTFFAGFQANSVAYVAVRDANNNSGRVRMGTWN